MTRYVVALLVLLAGACTPSAKDVRCSNQGDCQKANASYAYCVQNHCVECLDDPGCGEGGVCRDGVCLRRCFDGRDCSVGQTCAGGICSNQS